MKYERNKMINIFKKQWTICPYCGKELGWKFLFISKRINKGPCPCKPPSLAHIKKEDNDNGN